MAKRPNHFELNEPLRHPDHRRPRTRREFIAQGFALGSGAVLGANLLSLLAANPAHAALAGDLQAQLLACGSGGTGPGMIPFLCFDLAGGANIAGSNVLVGYKGGQLDFLSTSGYSLHGLPSGMAPNAPGTPTANLIDTSLGLAFHADSAFLRGIKANASPAALANTNGCVIPARSENDTGNNPHNPMYGIYRAGARGSLVNLIGTQNSDSGGNSMAPSMLMDAAARPTKVDRPSDVTGLVGTSTDLPQLLSNADTVAAMEAAKRISDSGIDATADYRGVSASADLTARAGAKCEILKSVSNTDQFGGTSPDPTLDPVIAGGSAGSSTFTPIFTGGIGNNSEFLKTASVMKLVVGMDAGNKHYASAGTITMGGFDYHTGDRATGEMRDERAGRCIGACLEYAHRLGVPLMLYVFSDGSLSSNGMIDNSVNGRGKNNWDSDNQSTSASFYLVYNPNGRLPAIRQQIGWMRQDGSVETVSSPGANSVSQLVDMVVLNYLSLNNAIGQLGTALNRPPASILGGTGNWDKYVGFGPIA